MVALAASDEARVRLALIPLLLRHPTFARDAIVACQALAATSKIVFKCYYTAARLLQQKYQARLALFTADSALLPDLYGAELGILPTSDPDQGLQQLAEQHALLSGKALSWLGTYAHAVQRWLTHMKLRRAWNQYSINSSLRKWGESIRNFGPILLAHLPLTRETYHEAA